MYDIANLCKDNGAESIVFVPSNRFDDNHNSTYFNTSVRNYILIKSEDNLENFYLKYYILSQDHDMEMIKNASH